MKAGKCYRTSRITPACPEVAVDGIKPSTFITKVINISNMQSYKLPMVTTQLTTEAETELNNRLSGFVDGGLHQWQRAIRQHGSPTSAQYRTLTYARNHLMSSIEALLGTASVLVFNPVAYARIHNEGGDIVSTPTVTLKMKKWFWAQYYKAGGKSGGSEAEL